MRIAILTSNMPGFSKPMAEGLQRMFARIDVTSDLYYQGHALLRRHRMGSIKNHLRSIQSDVEFCRFLAKAHLYNAVILVGGLPGVFVRSDFQRINIIRRFNGKLPIINYDVIFLGTQPYWTRPLAQGGNVWTKSGNNFGLERFDWYLVATTNSAAPLANAPWPVTTIGLDLDDGTLYPEEKTDFLALIDFERPNHMEVRATQIQALEATNTRYTVLNGRYSIPEIRAIYRKVCIYFLASSESFGLPICELQACGAYVFVPTEEWVPAHGDKVPTHPGIGRLSSNFVTYGANYSTLCDEILHIKSIYDPRVVRDTFLREQPHFYHGDTAALADFVERLESGQINGSTHRDHSNLMHLISYE